MYVVTVLFKLQPAHYEAFLQATLKNARTSLASEPGCQQFDVCAGGAGSCQVFLYEVYRTAAAFQAHLVMPHFLQFSAQTSAWVIDKTVQVFDRIVPVTEK